MDRTDMIKTFVIKTLGCKVNRFDSDTLEAALKHRGWHPAAKHEPVGLCIVNTCSVTGKGAMQSRQEIRRLVRRFPHARVVVTGCHAQVAPQELLSIEGVDDVVGTAEKLQIPDRVSAATETDSPKGGSNRDAGPGGIGEAIFDRPAMMVTGRRSRPVLKIQDGCDAFCTYCIVPYARGRSRSLAEADVLTAVSDLSEAGYREVVLSGIHLGQYGKDLSPPTELTALMRRMERSRPIRRVRLSSIEPNEIDEEMVEIIARCDLFCRHLHVPLQSGNDSVLRRMKRPYTAVDYSEKVEAIHQRLPDAGIGADVLIGFPGETEAAFADTYDLVSSLPLSYLHVFPFSPRPGTPASRYSGRVQEAVVRKRCRRMRRLGSQKQKLFLSGWVGKEVEVLVEASRDRHTGKLKGISSQYATVLLEGGEELKNRMLRVHVDAVTENLRLTASILPS
jgi:threonylcarbamoyladenosine tRNA methylthiotransferase MtaB